MSFEKALIVGLAGDKVSREITGTDEVTVSRTALATSSGGVLGLISIGAVSVAAPAAAAFVVPFAAASAVFGGLRSLFK